MLKSSRLAAVAVSALLAAGAATSAFDRAIDNSIRRNNTRRRETPRYPRMTEEQHQWNMAVDRKNEAKRAARYTKKAGE